MKKFLILMVISSLILPATTVFNNNQIKANANTSDVIAYIKLFDPDTFNLTTNNVETYLGELETIDLTSLTGFSDINLFKTFYSFVELPQSVASIGFMDTNQKPTLPLSWSTQFWNANWSSNIIKLVEGSKQVGVSFQSANLSSKIEISFQPIIKHLLLKISFYGIGYSRFVSTPPIVDIDSGKLVRLINKL